jgi:hypothetical protein
METPATVSAWAEETFGPVGSNFSVAARANREWSEALSVIAGGDLEHLGEELADTTIVLWRLLHRNGLSPICAGVFPGNGVMRDAGMVGVHLSYLIHSLAINDRCAGMDGTLSLILDRIEKMAEREGIDLQAEIDAKMICNRARTWRLDGNGHGSHVKETP